MIDLAVVDPDKGSALRGLGRGLGKLVSFLIPASRQLGKTKFRNPYIDMFVSTPYWFRETSSGSC